MAAETKIEWADHTFNPWLGCTKVSPACDHCYAEDWAKRFKPEAGLWQGQRQRTSPSTWRQPLTWNRGADAFRAKHGRAPMVFCASLADVFDNQVPKDWRRDLFDLIRQCDQIVWLLLTKRPQNIAKMLPDDWGRGWNHVWLGTTVENQEEANRRIPHLLAVQATKRFLSCEPLLGAIDVTVLERRAAQGLMRPLDGRFRKIDWVIAGGESGPHARPSHPDWFRSLRDQCAGAGTAFFFKQWGEFSPIGPEDEVRQMLLYGRKALLRDGFYFEKLGKKSTGRDLDGALHDARPADDLQPTEQTP
jgi:protein gp37